MTDEQPSEEQLIHGLTQEEWEKLTREQQLELEKQDFLNQLQRLQAEFQNYRSRVQRDQEDMKAAASEKILKEFLPLVDNLNLAIVHAKDPEGNIKGEDLHTGLLMINEQMKQMLEHQGLAEFAANGDRFDPHKHEAVTIIAREGAERGVVLDTYQRGYLRNGKVFRAAKVSVAK